MKFVIFSIFFFLSVVAGARITRQINPNFGFPNFPAFPQPTFNFQPGAPGTQTSYTSQTLSSRFGENEKPIVTGQSTHYTSTGNKYEQTNYNIRPDGSVTANKQSGRVRRQSPTSELKPQQNLQQQPSVPQQNLQQQQPHNQQNFQQQPNHQQNLSQQPNNQYPEQTIRQNPQPNFQQQQPNYPQQQQPNYPQQQQPNYQQQPYPQQPYYQQQPYPQQPFQPANLFPFGIGFYGQPQFGLQQPFGYPQPGFGYPQPSGPIVPQQGIPQQGNYIGATQTLDNRFGEEEGVVTTGNSQLITSQNGNYQITSSVLKPDGHVETSQQSGSLNKPNNKPAKKPE